MEKVLIALDIDGTLVSHGEPLSKETAHTLSQVAEKGHTLLFVSGRGRKWIERLVSEVDGPFYLSASNGALLFSHGDLQPIYSESITGEELLLAKSFSEKISLPVAFYPVDEEKPVIAYSAGSALYKKFYEERAEAFSEKWAFTDTFPHVLPPIVSVKWIAPHAILNKYLPAFEEALPLHLPLLQDPFSKEFSVLLGTAKRATKARPVRYVKEKEGCFLSLGAGDDMNDIPLFQESDYVCVLSTAKEVVQRHADFLFTREGGRNSLLAQIEKWVQNPIRGKE